MSEEPFEGLVKFYLSTTRMLLRDLGMSGGDLIEYLVAAISLGRADLIEKMFPKGDHGECIRKEGGQTLANLLVRLAKVMPGLKGELLDYHQWQIDPHSVVSFGAIAFGRRPASILDASGFSDRAGSP